MKEENKQSDQELLDIDEKGNYIENKKEQQKPKVSDAYKYFLFIISIIIILIGLAYFLILKKSNNKSVFDRTQLKIYN